MSGPKHTPAWERVVTLDDHDALKRELAEERDRAKRLAEALNALLNELPSATTHPVIVEARAALREAGVES